MSHSLVKISEATTLALHTVALLASRPEERLSNRTIALVLQASETHLAKVLARLSKNGLVKSVRGPNGGSVLAKKNNEITLYDIYSAIEGSLMPSSCLVGTPVCNGECILGDLLISVDTMVIKRLKKTKLSDLKTKFPLPQTA